MMEDLLTVLVDESVNEKPPVSPIADRLADEGSTPSSGVGESVTVQSTADEPRFGTVQSSSVFASTMPPPVSEGFDPQKHQVDNAGNPIHNKDGSFRKKVGRKKGSTTAGHSMGGSGTPANTTYADSGGDVSGLEQAKAAAIAFVSTLFIFAKCVMGDEWTPIVSEERGIDEPKVLIEAYTQYFMTVGITDIPPWLGVAIATTMYVAPRFTLPQTQTRVGKAWRWIKSFWSKSEPDPPKDESEQQP